MSTDADPSPAEPGDSLTTREELAQWFRDDPAGLERWRAVLEKGERGGYRPAAPELLALNRQALIAHRTCQAIDEIAQQIREIGSLPGTPESLNEIPKRLAAIEARLSDTTDALLDAAEPMRTNLIERLVPIREQVSQVRGELDRLL